MSDFRSGRRDGLDGYDGSLRVKTPAYREGVIAGKLERVQQELEQANKAAEQARRAEEDERHLEQARRERLEKEQRQEDARHERLERHAREEVARKADSAGFEAAQRAEQSRVDAHQSAELNAEWGFLAQCLRTWADRADWPELHVPPSRIYVPAAVDEAIRRDIETFAQPFKEVVDLLGPHADLLPTMGGVLPTRDEDGHLSWGAYSNSPAHSFSALSRFVRTNPHVQQQLDAWEREASAGDDPEAICSRIRAKAARMAKSITAAGRFYTLTRLLTPPDRRVDEDKAQRFLDSLRRWKPTWN